MNKKRAIYSIFRVWLALTVLGGALHGSSRPAIAATQIDIIGPAGSVHFGTSVTVLPNGNIVVTDPDYNGGIGVQAGAVYLYNGASGAMISMLTGTTAGDRIGSGGVTVLSNGNYVVKSPAWDNGAIADAGAVTWGNATSGIAGAVSASNSLVGSYASDQVGSGGVTVLSNGNYVVRSPYWHNGANSNAGAVTWGNGTVGISGAVSTANSLVGSTASDVVGNYGVFALSNGNYVVCSPYWHNGAVADAGAATWGNGTSGVTGAVSAANSLVGSTAGDQVGIGGVTVLSNGNYVVNSRFWHNGAVAEAGAATWGNGTGGVAGPVSASNSLVGSQASDRVGSDGATALSNGNYVVISHYWDNAAIADAGAVTWGNGTSGVTGAVSTANSLVGSTASDRVGYYGVTALSNGNYVVDSPYWDNAAITYAGAVTWGNGTSGVTGAVSAANSLVGSTAGDQVGIGGVTALSNGNYVVSSFWHNGAVAEAGAVTWGNGTSGVAGPVSASNSLVGSHASDQVGIGGVTVLSNGNYVVRSPNWANGGSNAAGAATWGNGTSGLTGAVSAANSLVGSTASDQVGFYGVTALSNGNYVVDSPYWDNGAIADAGAATWGNGTGGLTGAVSAANSLVGSTASDLVGFYGVVALNNGNYVVRSHLWDNGAIVNAGAATWGNGAVGISGAVSIANSLVGSTTSDQVGLSVTALSNGNYVVDSPYWDNAAVADAGAASWGNGAVGISGAVSIANSLVGSTASDQVGSIVTALSNGNYVVRSPFWDNAAIADAGAATWGFGSSGVYGPVSAANSVRGLAADGGSYIVFQYDATNRQLVVGRPWDNIVTLFRLPYVFLPVVRK